MGQGEVIQALEEEGGWRTAKQIREKLGTGHSVVSRILRTLVKHGEVECNQNKNSFGDRVRSPYQYRALTIVQDGCLTNIGKL